MTRKLSLLVAAIGTAGIAVTAAVSALPGASGVISLAANNSSTAKDKGPSPACRSFLRHFAGNLGVSPDKLNDSYRKSVEQAIDDAVDAKRLTAEQGKALKARLANRTACAGFRLGRDHRDGLRGAGLDYMAAAAVALHIDENQLRTDLKNGQSLSAIAAQQGVTEAQFRASLVSQLKPKLEQAKDSGKITADQEQKLLHRLETGPLPLWNRVPRPEAPATNSPAPTTT